MSSAPSPAPPPDGATDRFIDLVRHGEVQGGACFRGTQDDPLSDLGWAQLAAVELAGLTGIVSSPARRCADFARARAGALGLPLELAPALAERHFGAWEGRAAHQIPPAELAGFWADPTGYNPPGGEPFGDFRQRVLGGWQGLRSRLAPGGADRHRLLLTHGGVIRVILAQVLGLADSAGLLIEVPHACITRLRLPPPPGQPSLVSHGPGRAADAVHR